MTIGEKIAALRKQNNLTQEQLADKLGITAQAVSKWENSITSPDISLLKIIAQLFNITTDELLGAEVKEQELKQLNYITNKVRKNLMLKIHILSSDGDEVNINIPYIVAKTAITTGMKIGSVGDKLEGVDFEAVFECVEQGMLGKIVDIKSADGDIVEIIIE